MVSQVSMNEQYLESPAGLRMSLEYIGSKAGTYGYFKLAGGLYGSLTGGKWGKSFNEDTVGEL